jgi:hypothetical protein
VNISNALKAEVALEEEEEEDWRDSFVLSDAICQH